MNPIPMVTTSTSVSNPHSIAKQIVSQSSSSPFAQLLGSFISGQSNGSESMSLTTSSLKQLLGGQTIDAELPLSSSEDHAALISELLTQMELDGIIIDGEMIESSEGAKLLELLPVEWQQELLALTSIDNRHAEELMEDWTDLQQVLVVLLAAASQEQQPLTPRFAEKDKFLQQLQQLLAKMLPNVPWNPNGKQASTMLEDVTKYIESKLHVNPNGQANGQAFTELMTNKTNSVLPLPNAFVAQTSSDSPTQGLNLSQSGQELGQSLSRVEQAAIHIGDKLPKEVQQQQFLRQFQLILQRGTLTQNQQGMNTLSIKLYPEHLGRLDIQLSQIEGTIIARILTGSSATRELIEGQLAQLRHAFAQQQISVERIEVVQQHQQYVGKEQNDQSSQQNDDQSKQQDDENEQEQASLFQDVLNEVTFNEQV